MIDWLLGDDLGVLSCPFWSTVKPFSARLPIHTLDYCMDRVVSDASFLTRGVFECDLAHRRPVAVLCMPYKIRCNPMHSLHGALPEPYVSVRVTSGAVIAHRHTYALPRCRTSQYRRTFIPLSASLWKDLSDPVFDGVGLAVSRAGPMPFHWLSCSLIFCLLLFSLSLLSFYGLVLWDGIGVFGLIGC